MTPPAPPCRVDIRRTASRAQERPTTLACMMRCSRAASICSTRICVSRMPALFTSAATGQLAVRGVEQGQDAGFGRHIRAHGHGGPALPADRVDHRLRAVGARL